MVSVSLTLAPPEVLLLSILVTAGVPVSGVPVSGVPVSGDLCRHVVREIVDVRAVVRRGSPAVGVRYHGVPRQHKQRSQDAYDGE